MISHGYKIFAFQFGHTMVITLTMLSNITNRSMYGKIQLIIDYQRDIFDQLKIIVDYTLPLINAEELFNGNSSQVFLTQKHFARIEKNLDNFYTDDCSIIKKSLLVLKSNDLIEP